ncbi:MAG: Nramp family divalent metal transporter, partial [Verrucomicrobia subdivision 3 bacterium]|nr:Nramp family divalent metal transporter [Limisphaerales bacterium]
LFGPGAVIASLTIGAGELIFSSRAGAVFGYRLLWFFVVILALKWVLAFATARHMVLTGAHPFQRWMELPGPRGWFPAVFFLLALVCFPIWIGFHAGTLGTLLSSLAGTEGYLRGGAHLVWGVIVLVAVLALVSTGGYERLEKIQLGTVSVMLLSVVISLLLLKPDWLELLSGLLVPRWPEYPSWISAQPEIAARPVWVETMTYVGVLGGSGYDYLAYVSYLRAKHWGRAGKGCANARELAAMAADPNHADRKWLRALWIDSVLSFLAVLIFAGVFVTCGAMVLGPQHKVPGGNNLLQLQSEFISPLYPWLKPLYFVGAFLAIFGTLYGTIEVAPAILRELARAFRPALAETTTRRLRYWSVLWVSVGGGMILVWTLLNHMAGSSDNPPGLIALLTPANLFTGVLACGIICALSWWADRRYLPRSLWLRWPLRLLNGVAAIVFLVLGLKAYWDHSGWTACVILGGTLTAGAILVWAKKRFSGYARGQ